MNGADVIEIDDTDEELEEKAPAPAQQPSTKRLKRQSVNGRQPAKYLPAEWPHRVAHLQAIYNPDAISLPFSRNFGSYKCATPCREDTCSNAILAIFCIPDCCPYLGYCGNGFRDFTGIELVQKIESGSLAIVASEDIPKGVVLGQYLGRLTLEPPRKDRVRNTGYRLVMKVAQKNCGRWRVCIDAEAFGSLMRFVNHSCKSNCVFKQMSNGLQHTVVVVSTSVIKKGVEVTVDYGDDLWFVCRCDNSMCRHRDIQHLSDP